MTFLPDRASDVLEKWPSRERGRGGGEGEGVGEREWEEGQESKVS